MIGTRVFFLSLSLSLVRFFFEFFVKTLNRFTRVSFGTRSPYTPQKKSFPKRLPAARTIIVTLREREIRV